MATKTRTLTVEVMTLRARVAELEAQLEAATHAMTMHAAPAPIITRFHKADGSEWVKTRIGNRAVSRCVRPAMN